MWGGRECAGASTSGGGVSHRRLKRNKGHLRGEKRVNLRTPGSRIGNGRFKTAQVSGPGIEAARLSGFRRSRCRLTWKVEPT